MINDRDSKFLANTIYNCIFKVLYLAVLYFTVPIYVKYLGNTRYGIWDTILSIILWMNVANFGIGNGLRNKVTEAIANRDLQTLKSQISSSYYIISLISLFIGIIGTFIITFIDVNSIFKDNVVSHIEIKLSFIITILGFCINFVLGLASSIAYGIQKSYYVTFSQFAASFILLIATYGVYYFLKPSLVTISILYFISNTITNLCLSYCIFKKNKSYRPNIKKYRNRDAGLDVCKLGLEFFILQICTIVLFSTDNFVVSKFISVNEVAKYSITNKLFYIVISFYTILMIQLWNSVTEAFAKKEYVWIRKTIKKLLVLLIPAILVVAVIGLKFDLITNIWMNKNLDIDRNFIILCAIYTVIHCWNAIFVNIENGMGKIRIQMIAYLFASIIYIPLSVFLSNNLRLGISGVMLAKIICISIPSIACPIHVYMIIYRKENTTSMQNKH